MKRLFATLAAFWSLMFPCWAFAAGGGEVAPLVIVADTRKLSGLMAWWSDLYNESHVYFTLATVVIIPITGVIFGMIADAVMHMIGLDLTTRGHGGH